MSDRLPLGSAEVWLQFNLPTESHTAYSSIGLLWEPSDSPAGATDWIGLLLSFSETAASMLSGGWTCGPGYILIGVDGADPSRYDGSGSANAGLNVNALPPNCAYIMRKYTSRPGRRGRGRMFLPGCAEEEVEANGAVSVGQQGLLADVVEGWYSELAAFATAQAFDNMGLALLHNLLRYTVDNAPTPGDVGEEIPGSGLPPDLIGAVIPEGFIGTQRRRMPR